MGVLSVRPSILRPLPLDAAGQRRDLALAGGVLLIALVSLMLGAVAGLYGAAQAPLGYGVAYAFALALPLAVRRRWPGVVAFVVAIVYFTGVSLSIPEYIVGNIAVFLGFYSVGAWSPDRRRAVVVRALITVGMFVWLLAALVLAASASSASGSPGAVSGAASPYVAQSMLAVLINLMYFEQRAHDESVVFAVAVGIDAVGPRRPPVAGVGEGRVDVEHGGGVPIRA